MIAQNLGNMALARAESLRKLAHASPFAGSRFSKKRKKIGAPYLLDIHVSFFAFSEHGVFRAVAAVAENKIASLRSGLASPAQGARCLLLLYSAEALAN